MKTVTSPEELQRRCLAWRASGLSVALVPTMGFFHAGHESLMAEGRKVADKLVVSLFVNPAQFGPAEDLSAYPRDAERDAAIAASHGADILFTPAADAMYHADHATWVEVPELSAPLCGRTRPIHFRGVCTVVAKLFMLAQPTTAFFGQKDWQQLAVIRRMVRDLAIPVDIRGVPIVREADGLALSSRNAYLTAEERRAAPHLQKGLALAATLARSGTANAAALEAAIREYWQKNLPQGRVDYLSFVHPETLAPVERLTAPTLAAAAVFLGRARLIDNLLI